MKSLLPTVLCLFLTPTLWAQDPKGFEGAWVGSSSMTHKSQSPKVAPDFGVAALTYVFENIHDNTCTGFFWYGARHPWVKCEIKDGEITAYTEESNPIITGKIISATQLELAWHGLAPTLATFIATKQPPEY